MNRKQRRLAARQAVAGLKEGPGGFEQALAEATRHHEAGRLGEAEALYRRLLKVRRDAPEVLHLLGLALHQQGGDEEALECLERAVAGAPGAPMHHFNFAEVLRALGRNSDAIERYRGAIALDPGYADAHFGLGTAAFDAGDAEAAAASFRRALELRPGDVEAWLNLGNAHAERGALDEAEASYRRALRLTPDYVEAHVNLGCVLKQAGDAESALASFRRAVEIAPDFAEAHYEMAVVSRDRGLWEQAAASFRAAAAAGHASALVELSLVLREQGDLDGAIAACEQALAAGAGVAASLALGGALLEAGRIDEAETALRTAVATAPEDAGTWLELGNMYLVGRRFDAAVAALERATELAPDLAVAAINLGNALIETGRLDDAFASYRRALAADPENIEAHYNVFVVRRQQGDFATARQALDRVLELEPDHVEALAALGTLAKYAEEGEDAARMRRRLEGGALTAPQRMSLHFGLGKLYDDLGRYDEAFEQYRSGNEIEHARLGFDRAAHARLIDRIRAVFDAEFLAARADWGAGSERPVFILGVPRSGTTLVEQILASHPQFHGAGELRKLTEIAEALPVRLESELDYPEAAAALDRGTALALAEEYLEALGTHAGEARRVSDKMPDNFLRLGLIAMLLPRARIIHCRRGALDACLSCYFQNFAGRHRFSTDLTDLGHYHHHYERLMAHWREVLPGRVLEVDYEAIVAGLEEESRRLVEFCGLDWDPRCLAFHETERPVRTASQWQVRQPLFTTSAGRWRNYDKHLAPLRAALAGADT